MSSQGSQKIRRNGSPSIKQGPMRATQQFGLVHATTSAAGGRKGSPCPSPTVGATTETPANSRPSSETRFSTDRRSPTSASSKERSKHSQTSSSELIRRTGSLDTIVGPYLSGQWPRDTAAICQCPQSPALVFDIDLYDKQTQTPEEWDDVDSRRKKVIIKQRLHRTKDMSKPASSVCGAVTGGGNIVATQSQPQQMAQQQQLFPGALPAAGHSSPVLALQHSMPIKIPSSGHNRGIRIRGSVEGLNQEVEKLIISGTKRDSALDRAAEGRRAPVAEMLLGTSSSRSVDTQTPTTIDESRCSSGAGGGGGASGSRSQSISPSVSPPEYGSSPELPFNHKNSLSPMPNNIFMREPPDGCEKVKIGDEPRSDSPTAEPQSILIFPTITSGELKRSEGSAFYPLRPIKLLHQSAPTSGSLPPGLVEEAT